MSVPPFNELFLDVLKLANTKKEYKTAELTKELEDILDLSPEDRNARIKSGSTVFENRVGWANTYLFQAGLLERVRWGYYCVSKEGKELLNTNPNKITEEDLMNYPKFLEFVERSNNPKNKGKPKKEPNSKLTPEDKMEIAYEENNQKLRNELIECIFNNTPYFFEKLVVDLLVNMGYGGKEDSGIVTSPTADGGIDGMINEDTLGLDKIGIQAKRYKDGVIGTPEIDKFIGALVKKGLKKGVFITTSKFTTNALKEEENQTDPNIVLIDGDKLADLMIEYELGTSTKSVYKIRKIDMDYFNEE